MGCCGGWMTFYIISARSILHALPSYQMKHGAFYKKRYLTSESPLFSRVRAPKGRVIQLPGVGVRGRRDTTCRGTHHDSHPAAAQFRSIWPRKTLLRGNSSRQPTPMRLDGAPGKNGGRMDLYKPSGRRSRPTRSTSSATRWAWCTSRSTRTARRGRTTTH